MTGPKEPDHFVLIPHTLRVLLVRLRRMAEREGVNSEHFWNVSFGFFCAQVLALIPIAIGLRGDSAIAAKNLKHETEWSVLQQFRQEPIKYALS